MMKLGKSNRVLYHLTAADFTICVVSAIEASGETVFPCYKFHVHLLWLL